jgi:lipoprotein-anchoring transpeptidase ErfK/SrfK
MTTRPTDFSRRDFLKVTALGLGGLAFPYRSPLNESTNPAALPDFPQAERLGRVLDSSVKLKARPDIDSADVGVLYEDDVVVWLNEVVGSRPMWFNQRFVETPEGYIYAPNLQLVRFQTNQPLTEAPGPEGVWVEVTVPYVDLTLANPPGRAPWLGHTQTPRLYYSQIMWVDDIQKGEDGQVYYRVSDRYGSFGDFFWAAAEAMRPLTDEDISPIRPDVENKRVLVNLSTQTLSCYEGDQEVYFCRVSTGPKLSSESSPKSRWATPIGMHTVWRKLYSTHMTGGTTGGGYDLPGIGWTVLFSGQGMAIHSTFWHNSYGVPRSHGCVNCSPEDAQWIFRWTPPVVPPETGEITISGMDNIRVEVIET